MCVTEMYAGFWFGHSKERDYLENQDLEFKIILKLILNK